MNKLNSAKANGRKWTSDMTRLTKQTCGLLACILTLFVLTGCGGPDIESGSNNLLTCDSPLIPDSTGTECVAPPPIECDPPTVPNEANNACVVGADPTLPDPVFFPGEYQAVLYYNRGSVDADNVPNDPAYEGWRLHTWNNDTCDAYADADTDWANGRQPTGIDPNFGAYWVLELKENYGTCHNFIIHKGTDDAGKEMGGGDFAGSLVQDDETYTRMNFTLSGEAIIFEFPIISLGEQPVDVEGLSAHWLDVNTILWNAPEGVDVVELHYSETAGLESTLEDGLNGTVLTLTETTLTDEQIALAPHLQSMQAWQGDWDEAAAKAVLKTQTAIGGYNGEGKLVAATGIQLANVLDVLYTSGDDDANEATLGPVYTDTGISAVVWAPTAQQVSLLSYSDSKSLQNTYPMTLDENTGIWRYDGDMSLDRTLYRFEVTVYHPVTGELETLQVTDPYSVSLSTNSRFSRFVNLSDDDLKPDGWDTQTIPTIADPEDAVIYEGHIRDFSILDESTSEANRGKYLAFTEEGTAPVAHLQKLADAGLTHFHMLPANDIASVDENPANVVNINDTVGDLCRLNRNAAICDEEPEGTVIKDLLESYDPASEGGKAQALVDQMRGYDSFNWGYDPYHFNVPEGSYASDAEGVQRIVEMRAMNMALHEIGLRVVLDVVYNHTNASGVYPRSVLDKVVPGYYHRYDVETGAMVQETCCEDTEPRQAMMEKLMLDSLLLWTEQYKFDSFRFDIMSQATVDTMVRLRDAVQAIDEDNYFYGEGWLKEDRGYEQANQINMGGTQIGTYNDRIRDAIRYGHLFNPESDEALSAQDRLKMGMAGTLTDYVLETSGGSATTTSSLGGYAQDPADVINYVSKHDNETLWDQFNYSLPMDLTLEERVRAQNIGITLPLMSQGIPFLQMGGDFLRSKSMDRNSYDAGDWFNYVDFTFNTNNWNIGLPLAVDNSARWDEMSAFIYDAERAASMGEIEFASTVFDEYLMIRSGSKLFRLTTMDDIIQRVGFHNIGARQQVGLVAMSIDDGYNETSETPLADIDPAVDAIMVVVNTGYEEKSITVATATGFELHNVLINSVDNTVRTAMFTEGTGDDEGNGTFTVPALTTAVFVKPQMGAQGYGLSAYATAGAPDVVPFGDTVAYLRGDMNGWGTDTPFTYQGDGVYTVTATLNAGTTYGFKMASEDWATVNLGAADGSDGIVTLGNDMVLGVSNTNLSFTPAETALYEFRVDASDTSAPILTVNYDEPFAPTTVYLRGDMNGWGTDDAFSYQGDKVYTFATTLEPGTYQFKIASEDWSTVNLGGMTNNESDTAVNVGATQFLAATNENLVLTIEASNSYVFVLSARNGEIPTIGVFEEQFFGATPVFIRGGMNSWGTDNTLTWQGDGTYTADIVLSGGATEFKVASEDWSTVNFGNPDGEASNEVMVDVPKVLGVSNNNLMINAEAGTYRFTVSGPDGSKPVITVTAL